MFNVFNDSGILIMDANDSQLALVGVFTIYLTSTSTTYSTGITANCLIGLGNTGGAYVRVKHNQANGVLTISSDSASVNVVVHLYANLKDITQVGNAGLNVFDGAGRIVFDATRKVARIAGAGSSQFSDTQSVPVNSVPVLDFVDLLKIIGATPQGTGVFIFHFGSPFYKNNGSVLSCTFKKVLSVPIGAARYPTQPNFSAMNIPILFFKV